MCGSIEAATWQLCGNYVKLWLPFCERKLLKRDAQQLAGVANASVDLRRVG
jgi:hypothetical protein